MASGKRKPGESFEDYRARIKSEGYLGGLKHRKVLYDPKNSGNRRVDGKPIPVKRTGLKIHEQKKARKVAARGK